MNRIQLSDRSRRLFGAILMATYGWGRTQVQLGFSELHELTGLTKDQVSRARKELVERNMVAYIACVDARQPALYRPNKKYGSWSPAPTMTDGVRAVLRGVGERQLSGDNSGVGERQRLASANPTVGEDQPSGWRAPTMKPLFSRFQSQKSGVQEVEEVEEVIDGHSSTSLVGRARRQSSDHQAIDDETHEEIRRLLHYLTDATAETRPALERLAMRGAQPRHFADARCGLLAATNPIGNKTGWAVMTILDLLNRDKESASR